MSDNDQNPNFPKTQDELDRIIQDRVASKNRRIQELEAGLSRVESERDAARADVTARDEKIQGLEKDKGDLSREVLVTRVAHEKGVPARWLTGDDEESLVAAADEWLRDAQGVSGGSPAREPEPAQEPGAGQPQRGVVPSAGTGEEKPPRPSYDEIRKQAYEKAKTL